MTGPFAGAPQEKRGQDPTIPGPKHNQDQPVVWERWQKKRTFVRALEGTYSHLTRELLDQPRVISSRSVPWKGGPNLYGKHVIAPGAAAKITQSRCAKLAAMDAPTTTVTPGTALRLAARILLAAGVLSALIPATKGCSTTWAATELDSSHRSTAGTASLNFSPDITWRPACSTHADEGRRAPSSIRVAAVYERSMVGRPRMAIRQKGLERRSSAPLCRSARYCVGRGPG